MKLINATHLRKHADDSLDIHKVFETLARYCHVHYSAMNISHISKYGKVYIVSRTVRCVELQEAKEQIILQRQNKNSRTDIDKVLAILEAIETENVKYKGSIPNTSDVLNGKDCKIERESIPKHNGKRREAMRAHQRERQVAFLQKWREVFHDSTN